MLEQIQMNDRLVSDLRPWEVFMFSDIKQLA